MALTVEGNPANVGRSEEVWGRVRVAFRTVTFDASYPTGGEAFDPAQVGIPTPRQVICTARPTDSDTTLYVVAYNPAEETLQVFQQTDPADTGGANIPLIEVDDATDLSGLVVDVLVIGD